MTAPSTQDARATGLVELAERVEAAHQGDNNLDVLVEMAFFQPDDDFTSIRANSAGTKVICTTAYGHDATFRARDWTFTVGHRRNVAASLRALATSTKDMNHDG